MPTNIASLKNEEARRADEQSPAQYTNREHTLNPMTLTHREFTLFLSAVRMSGGYYQSIEDFLIDAGRQHAQRLQQKFNRVVQNKRVR